MRKQMNVGGILPPRERHPLGTSAKTVSRGVVGAAMGTRTPNPPKKKKRTPEEESAARVRRFALQNEAARLLPNEKVSRCLRKIAPMSGGVHVQYSPSCHSAHYVGLQVCSSVWHCPICAAKISERRRVELERIIKKHCAMGGSVYMTTYTIRHQRYDDLQVLLAHFLEARRKMRQGRNGQRLREHFQIFGTVSVLEVTWSQENGWHPHIHELVFCTASQLAMDDYEAEARQAWKRAAEREGLEMNEHGFKLDRTYGAVADYIAKFGREPAKGSTPWGVEAEMVKGHLKQARTSEHYSPFALLAAIADGVEELKPIFAEYARCFKGRKQLTYSPGLKNFYNEEEKTDEELATETQEDAVTLVVLPPEQWAGVLGNDIRGELLEVARTGNVDRIVEFLEGFGIVGVSPGIGERAELSDVSNISASGATRHHVA